MMVPVPPSCAGIDDLLSITVLLHFADLELLSPVTVSEFRVVPLRYFHCTVNLNDRKSVVFVVSFGVFILLTVFLGTTLFPIGLFFLLVDFGFCVYFGRLQPQASWK